MSRATLQSYAESCWAFARGASVPVSELRRDPPPPPPGSRAPVALAKLLLGLGGLGMNLFDLTAHLLCVYAVAICDRADSDAVEWARDTVPQKRPCPADCLVPSVGVVAPVVFERGSGRFRHFERIPLRGNVYYKHLRGVIRADVAGPLSGPGMSTVSQGC